MKFSKKVLPNGIRLITAPLKDHPTVTVMVLVEAGSKYETRKENGISHFLEHMCFKGTEKRPSALIITRELDSIGAAYNAFTGQEFTGYYAKCDFRHVSVALDVVSDIYLNSTLPDAEMQKEKGVIIEEINMYEDLPQRKVQDVFTELLYGDTPAGWSITGPKENILAFTRQDFVDYRTRHYVAEATAVIVAGNFDEKKITADIEKIFGGARHGKKDGKEKVNESQSAPHVKLSYKETDQAHFVLGVRSFDVYDERNSGLRVLSAVLGGGMSSRLFQKVRDEMGAAYYVGAANETFTDHGYFEVAAGVDQKRVDEVITAVLGELTRLKEELVPDDELQKVKDYLTGTMFLSLETSDALSDLYGYQEIMRKPIKTPDEIRARIESVTADDVRKLARELFVATNLNLALIGKYKDESRFTKLLSV